MLSKVHGQLLLLLFYIFLRNLEVKLPGDEILIRFPESITEMELVLLSGLKIGWKLLLYLFVSHLFAHPSVNFVESFPPKREIFRLKIS